MNVLIVWAHPSRESFIYALADSLREEFEARDCRVRMRDLHEDSFNPVLGKEDFQELSRGSVPTDIAREQELVRWADALVFLYPIWWYDRPAILKGWIDRVFQHRFAYEAGASGVKGLLNQKKAMVIVTNGNAREGYSSADPDSLVLNAMTVGTLQFCGISKVVSKVLYGVSSALDHERKSMIEDVRSLVRNF